MADPIKGALASAYWKKQGDELARNSGSAGLPPRMVTEGFLDPGWNRAQIGGLAAPVVQFNRPTADNSLSDAQGHLVGSGMAQMMQKNYDAADQNQRRIKLATFPYGGR